MTDENSNGAGTDPADAPLPDEGGTTLVPLDAPAGAPPLEVYEVEEGAELMTDDAILDVALEHIEGIDDLVLTGGVDDAKAWLEEWREPLTHLAANRVVGALQSVTSNSTRTYLRSLFRSMSAADMVLYAEANADTFKRLANTAAREAAIVAAANRQMSNLATTVVLRGITTALAVL